MWESLIEVSWKFQVWYHLTCPDWCPSLSWLISTGSKLVPRPKLGWGISALKDMVATYMRLHEQKKWTDRSLMKFKGKRKVLPPRWGNPVLLHRLGTDGVRSWWTTNCTRVSNEPLQQQRWTSCWTALAPAQPTGWEMWLFPSAWYWRGCTWNTRLSPGLPSPRETWTRWTKFSEGPSR